MKTVAAAGVVKSRMLKKIQILILFSDRPNNVALFFYVSLYVIIQVLFQFSA